MRGRSTTVIFTVDNQEFQVRALTFDELAYVSGGDGCGAGGDCGDGGDGGDGGSGGDASVSVTGPDSAVCVSGDGTVTCGDSVSPEGIATVTITGEGFGQALSLADAAQLGGAIGGAIGIAAFVLGTLPLSMSLGLAIAVGTALGAIIGIASSLITDALISFYGITIVPESTGP
jgi:hypothetical protein